MNEFLGALRGRLLRLKCYILAKHKIFLQECKKRRKKEIQRNVNLDVRKTTIALISPLTQTKFYVEIGNKARDRLTDSTKCCSEVCKAEAPFLE